jgi:5-carboxymethyl-2-hydroxymuconate isomerase
MKLASFFHGDQAKFGLVDGDALVDLTGRLGGAYSSLKELLAGASPADVDAAAAAAPRIPAADVRWRLPIPAPDKILCLGRNYANYHEVQREGRPEWPTVFGRFTSSFVAHGEAILRPRVSEQLDYEGELGVVIGRPVRHAAAADAMQYVAGYTIVNEGSVRDWQRRGRQNCPGKNFYCSGSMGPWLVTADEVPDPAELTIVTRVDGEERQRGRVADMLFTIAEAIAHISAFTRLEPGDVVSTGSPGGSAVDGDPPRWLEAGQRLEIEIEPLGVLVNSVVAE